MLVQGRNVSIAPLTRQIQEAGYDGQEIGHAADLYATIRNGDGFDHAVSDINVTMAGMDQTANSSYDDTAGYDDIADTPLDDLADDDGTFKVEIPPGDNIRMMQDIAHHATLWVPDHIMDCLYKGLERSYKGTRHYHDAERIADGITDFLNFYAEPLPVKEKMGLERYSTRALNDRHPHKNEDDFIVDAAQELDGDVVVMTYDEDYLDLPVTAASPKAVAHVLGGG